MSSKNEVTLFNSNTIKFEKSSEELFVAFILSYIRNSGREYVTSLRMEKLLVIFLKIGIENNFFNLSDKDARYKSMLSVRYYLHGSIVAEVEEEKQRDHHFLHNSYTYFSNKLTSDNHFIKNENKYFVGLKDELKDIGKIKFLKATDNIGKLFSNIIEKEKYIKDDDLIILTSCYSTNDILGSMFAELKLFKSTFIKSFKKDVPATQDLRKQQYFVAINSGLFKFSSFLKKDAHKIVLRVAGNLEEEDKELWSSLWPKSDLDFNLVDEGVFKQILNYGLLLYKTNILIRLLDPLVKNIGSKDKNLELITKNFYGILRDMLPERYTMNLWVQVDHFHKFNTSSSSSEELLDELQSIYSKFNENGIAIPEPEKSLESWSKPRTPKKMETINVLIASPGDTAAERAYLIDKLERKFRTEGHEELCGKRLIIHAWEDVASQGGYGQDIINYKLLKNVDIVLAVFKHKLGTPTIDNNGTPRADSGTAEELLYALDNNGNHSFPLGMAYFHERPPVVQLDSRDKEKIETEWERLKTFRAKIQSKVLYKSYDSKNDLLNKVCIDLSQNIRDYF